MGRILPESAELELLVTSADSLTGVVLAAGAGERLRPLTRHLPKALCPVGGVPLVDHAIDRVAPVADRVAVNVHAHQEKVIEHLAGRVFTSIEDPVALGTAGALGTLRPWIAGSDVMVANSDAWFGGLTPIDLRGFVDDWDHERPRLLCVDEPARGDFGTLRYAGVCLMPWSIVAGLEATPSGLYEKSWRAEFARGNLDLVTWDGAFIDCGTIGEYLAANMEYSGGASVIGPGAQVDGQVTRCVVWADSTVHRGEVLTSAIRGPDWTVLSR